jgi:valyl-tRNA synthetase
LEVAAADAVREGRLEFTPASAREEFLARAGQGGDWCVSYQVVAGQPVPAASCLDCGRLSVSVEPLDDCPRCMGELSPDLGVLDARFVGAVWPLAAAGWPARRATALDIVNTALAGTPGVISWAVAMAALGLRLARVVPFTEVVIYSLETPDDDPDPVVPDLEDLMTTVGASQLRAALLKGGLP